MANQVDSTSTGSAVSYPSHDSSAPGAQLLGAQLSEGNASQLPPQSRAPRAGIVRRFLELIRFSHTIFALPFAALACVFALTIPNPASLSPVQFAARILGVLLCMVTARSAAMAFNRLVDARIDGKNPRTASRHIPAGQLSNQQVWLFFAAMSLAFIAACGLFWPNWLPLACSVPVLAWICGYSFAKRFTSAAHLWLGIALALSPICAWVAIRGEAVIIDANDLLPAVALAASIALWVAGFDIIYACQDADFDRSQKLHSIPARFGIAGALRIAATLHLAMLITLCGLPLFSSLHLQWIYGLTLAGVAAMVITQHSLVRANDLTRVNIAFFNVNAVISFGFCSLTALDCWLG